MVIKKIVHYDDFDKLSIGDELLVEWNEKSFSFREGNRITCSKIVSILIHDDSLTNEGGFTEVVMADKGLYFSVDMFIRGDSMAKEIYLAKPVD